MPLLAYNLTDSPVPLAASRTTIPNLPASGSPPSRGVGFNVTSEMKPDKAVDPARGIDGGLDAAGFTAIQAQVTAKTIEIEWTGDPEYKTGAVTPGGPTSPSLSEGFMEIVPADAEQTITGSNTEATVDFQTKFDGANPTAPVFVDCAAWHDEDLKDLASGDAALLGASVGSISAEHLTAVTAKTDATGRSTLKLRDTRAEPRDLKIFHLSFAGASHPSRRNVVKITFDPNAP